MPQKQEKNITERGDWKHAGFAFLVPDSFPGLCKRCALLYSQFSRATVQLVKGQSAQYSAKCVVLVAILIIVFQQLIINVYGPNRTLLF